MLKHLALAALFTTAFAGTAFAQGEEDPFAEDVAAEPEPMAEPDPQPAAPAATASADGDFYKMAISTTFISFNVDFGLGDAILPTADMLYGLDADTYLDLKIGVNFNKKADPMNAGESISTFGIDFAVGYRMYKPTEGKIRPYLKPFGQVAVGDFSAAGDTLAFAAGAAMGVDYALMEQFTLGVDVGAQLSFRDSFDTISFGLSTSNVNATFWW